MQLESVLKDFGDNVTRLAKINLGKTKVVNGRRRKIDNSGALRNSIDYSLVKTPKGYRWVLVMEEYGVVVDGGRKAGKGVPLQELRNWIKSKPIRIRDLKTKRFVTATESRINSLIYLINRKIKTKGIAPTNFLSDPFDKELQKLPEDVQEALLTDIVEVLDLSFNNLTNFK